jgi:CubicO group peptidase (beta-lactamase class C family)
MARHRGLQLVGSLFDRALIACSLAGTPTVVPPTIWPPIVTSPTVAPPATAIAVHSFDLAQFKHGPDAAMPAFMSANDVAGCSAAVVYPDPSTNKLQTQLFNYGVASRATQKLVDSSTLYEIGSITKLFTADVLALFVGQNLMGLDDSLQK